MALFDFLKRKKEVEKAREKSVKTENKSEKKAEEASVIKDSKKPILSKGKKVKGFSYEVIREPHISEKATNLAEHNKYVFKVYNNTNKHEIKKSVEGIHGVDVLGVAIIKIPAKRRRIGRTEGFKKGYAKAVVTIKEGQKIEVF